MLGWGGGGGGGGARIEISICGFIQYTLLQNRDNSGHLGTPMYYSLKFGGEGGGIAIVLKLGRCPPAEPEDGKSKDPLIQPFQNWAWLEKI